MRTLKTKVFKHVLCLLKKYHDIYLLYFCLVWKLDLFRLYKQFGGRGGGSLKSIKAWYIELPRPKSLNLKMYSHIHLYLLYFCIVWKQRVFRLYKQSGCLCSLLRRDMYYTSNLQAQGLFKSMCYIPNMYHTYILFKAIQTNWRGGIFVVYIGVTCIIRQTFKPKVVRYVCTMYPIYLLIFV